MFIERWMKNRFCVSTRRSPTEGWSEEGTSIFAHLHRDERGTISILSVFTALMLTMILGMVMNVGRQVDGKIRLQNAADAAAYAGGLELARALNSLTFTNHMMCEIIAMTAILREASNLPQYNGQLAATQSPKILAAWQKAADILQQSTFVKFQKLGADLKIHLQQEQEFVTVFSQWGAAFSADILPVLEYILENELLPKYQRNLVEVYPRMAQAAAFDAARRNGDPDYRRDQMYAALWRSDGQRQVGDPSNEAGDDTIPAVDPILGTMPDQPTYLKEARQQRAILVKHYLKQWNLHLFQGLDLLIPFSKFRELWAGSAWNNGITCGRLDDVLGENADKNLPFQIRKMTMSVDEMNYNSSLKYNYAFIGAAYWKKVPQLMPRIFHSATESDSVAYAEVHVFIPKPRLVWGKFTWPVTSTEGTFFGNLNEPSNPEQTVTFWAVTRQIAAYFPPNQNPDGFPSNWNLLTQNWTCQLKPATQEGLNIILQQVPQLKKFDGIIMPKLGEMNSKEIQQISPH